MDPVVLVLFSRIEIESNCKACASASATTRHCVTSRHTHSPRSYDEVDSFGLALVHTSKMTPTPPPTGSASPYLSTPASTSSPASTANPQPQPQPQPSAGSEQLAKSDTRLYVGNLHPSVDELSRPSASHPCPCC